MPGYMTAHVCKTSDNGDFTLKTRVLYVSHLGHLCTSIPQPFSLLTSRCLTRCPSPRWQCRKPFPHKRHCYLTDDFVSVTGRRTMLRVGISRLKTVKRLMRCSRPVIRRQAAHVCRSALSRSIVVLPCPPPRTGYLNSPGKSKGERLQPLENDDDGGPGGPGCTIALRAPTPAECF